MGNLCAVTSTRGHRPATSRSLARFGALGALTSGAFLLAVALAAPVSALERDDGDDPGEQISKLEALLIFGVIPVAAMLTITLLVCLPWLLRGQRKSGEAAPEWFGAPEGTAEVTGHGEQAELTGRVVGADGGDSDADGGGSSARW